MDNKKKDTHILLGTTAVGQTVNLPLEGHQINNFHFCMTGKSGQGKTNALKNYALQAVSSDFPVIIIDSSGSFLPDEQNRSFWEQANISVHTVNVYQEGLNINPYASIYLNSHLCEKACDTAKRVSELYAQVISLGAVQRSLLYDAVLSMLNSANTDKSNSTSYILKYISDTSGNEAVTLFGKLKAFFDQGLFNLGQKHIDYYENKSLYIFNLQYFTDETKKFISEIILWNIWNQALLRGNIENKLFVVADEAQLFNHSSTAAIGRILTEGRKFGIGLWLSTQFLKDNFSVQALSRINQAAIKIYFKPSENELARLAKEIDSSNKDWITILKSQR